MTAGGLRFRGDSAFKAWLPLAAGAITVALLLGVALGRVLGPVATTDVTDHDHGHHGAPETADQDGHVHGGEDSDASEVEGLSLSQQGYMLQPAEVRYSAKDEPQTWEFTIVDAEGDAVTDFATVHDAPMHLFVVRQDLSGFQHLHPQLDPESGVWSVELTFDSAGPWRVYTEFAVDTQDEPQHLALGVDVTVPGDYQPESLAEPSATTTVNDQKVELNFAPEVGVNTPLLVSVQAEDEPASLQPYMGAYGHLVIVRQDDMGFLHVHPEAELVDGAMRFWCTIPSAGTYRMYLNFQTEDQVELAEFTITVD